MERIVYFGTVRDMAYELVAAYRAERVIRSGPRAEGEMEIIKTFLRPLSYLVEPIGA